jgi:serine/threonine protein kinase/ankyrin repeat protein
VFRARNKTSNEVVAVKVVSRADSVDTNTGNESPGLIEVEILQRVGRHPNLVRLRGVHACARTGDVWLSLELMTGGSVAALIDALGEPLSEPEIVTVCRDLLNALAWLHQCSVIHRDIKAGNIMLARDTAAVKLIDFGVSAFCLPGAQRQSVIGTPLFMAPEMIDNTGMPSPYDQKVDIWALGVTMIELAQMRPPHHDVNPMRAIFLIPVAPPPLLAEPERWSADFVRVQRACVRKDPQTRPIAADLLRDVWLGGKQKRITSLAESLSHSAVRGAVNSSTASANGDDSAEAQDNAATLPGRRLLVARLARVAALNDSKPAMTRAQKIAAALAELDDETESEHLDVSSSSDDDDDDANGNKTSSASHSSSIAALDPSIQISPPRVQMLQAGGAAKFRAAASPGSTRRTPFIGLRRTAADVSLISASTTTSPTASSASLSPHGVVGRASSGVVPTKPQLVLPTQPGSDRQVPMPPMEHLVLDANQVIVPRLVERQLVQKHLVRLRKLQMSHEKEQEKLRRTELFDIEQKHAKYIANVTHLAKDAQASQAKLVALQATRRAERARQNDVERKALVRRSASTSSEHLAQVKARQRAERKAGRGRGDASSIGGDSELIDARVVDMARLPKPLLRLAVEQRHEIELARVRQRAAVRDLAALHRMQVDDAQRASTFAAHDLAEQHHAALAVLAQIGDAASEHHAAALALQVHHLVLRQRLLQSQMLQRQALERQQQQEFVTVCDHAARKSADARRKVATKRIKEARKDAATNKQAKARLAQMEEEHEALLRAIDADYHEALRRAQPVLDDLSGFHFYQQRRLADGVALRKQSLLVALNRCEFSYQLAKHQMHYRLRASQLHEREQLWRNASQGELSLTDALYERRRDLTTRSNADEEALVQQLASVRRDLAVREQCDAALVSALGDATYGLEAVRKAGSAEQAALAEVQQRERATLQADMSKKIALASTEIESLERERLKTRADLLLAHGDDAKRLRGARIAARRVVLTDDGRGPLVAAAEETVVPPAVLDALFRAAQSDDVEKVLSVALAHAPTAPATVLRAVDADGCGLLHHAVRSGRLAVLQRFGSPSPSTARDAVRQCCALETADRHFVTPTLLAGKIGALAAVAALLDLGAETRTVSEDGNTILHFVACISGADDTLYDDVLTSLVQLCKLSARNRAGDSALHIAAANRQAVCVRTLLAASVDVNARNAYADTPLHNAVRVGDAEIVRLLLNAGALPTVEGMNGDALQVAQAASPPSTAIIELLSALPALVSQRAAMKRVEPCSMLLDDALLRYRSSELSQFFVLQSRTSSSASSTSSSPPVLSPSSPRSPRSPRGQKKSPDAPKPTASLLDSPARQDDRRSSYESAFKNRTTASATVRVLDPIEEFVGADDGESSSSSSASSSSSSSSSEGGASQSMSDSTSASTSEPKAPSSVSPGAQHYDGRRVRVMRQTPTLATVREESPSPPPPPARMHS